MKMTMKRFLALLFSAILLYSSFGFFVRAAQTGEETTDGAASEEASVSESEDFDADRLADADADGKITSADARLVLRCAVKLEKADEYISTYGDTDRNGSLDSEDARAVLRLAVGIDSVKCLLYGHALVKLIVAPACVDEGYTSFKCESCTYSDPIRTDIAAPLGHSPEISDIPASCTEDGVYTIACTLCGSILEKRVTAPKTGHKFGIWEIKGNVKERVCSSCSFVDVSDKIKTVYLTFDDGPGPYTEKLLGYLRHYGVKATFFVTNQMPKYKHLLSRIVADGHAIGVHTLTHQWTIYSGRQSYLNDFNAMHKIILDETGVDTKIFRFPGGTNNTVSRSYSRGIMADLSKYMTAQGFIYFDWNVDCCDTLGYSSARIASTTINQIKNRNTSIVLMHDIKNTTVEAVKTIIEFCIANGYELAVIDESAPRIQFAPVN